ncbi:uncharacterized protein ACBR49_017470 [Aulostomus maculatus]
MEDETEMTKRELQMWIRRKVNEIWLMARGVTEKYKLLRSLQEKRDKQACSLLSLIESVAACDAIVKEHYALLGWEYRHTDSDDSDNLSGDGNMPSTSRVSIHSETRVLSCQSTNAATPPLPKKLDSTPLKRVEVPQSFRSLNMNPVVVLNRLTDCDIASLAQPTPVTHDRDRGSSGCLGSDMNPRIIISDSEPSVSSPLSKRRKPDKRKSSQQASAVNTNRKKKKANKAPVKIRAMAACSGSALTQSSEVSMDRTEPAGQINVNMMVVARRKACNWQQGKIIEIITTDNGKMKYKIGFEDKRKVLVSGHHIAFANAPKEENLHVGARVVVEHGDNNCNFSPGIVAEKPSRKNHLRFLVFLDDHTPVYVSSPSLHLVIFPLADPLDDIPVLNHRNFMKDYLKGLVCPPYTEYKKDEILRAELGGVLQPCRVVLFDSSLIQVVFQNGIKEWIHRGSMRWEHVMQLKQNLESQRDASKKTAPDHGPSQTP